MADVRYAVAQLSDSDEIVGLLAKTFSASEPPAVAMRLSCGEMKQFLRVIAPQIIPHQLTLLARAGASNQPAGVLLTDDFASPPALNAAQISPKFLPIFSMLQRLDDDFRAATPALPGTHLHLFMLAVSAQFAGCGVAQGLVKACLENGIRRGYRTALTEATGKISQHVFRKNGFADRCSIPYAEFAYEGRPVFASLREHERAILMDRSLVQDA